ncbi:MAG: hypothetical protein IT373_09045 [Polyangiaceae bacterium]|nr:hypothetical protein [Polyangiaceae bacterium]
MRPTAALFVAALPALAACGAPPAAPSAVPGRPGAASVASAPAAELGATATGSAPLVPPPPPAAAVPAAHSPVPGPEPLDPDEAKYVRERCAALESGLQAEVRRAAGGDVGRERATTLALELLARRSDTAADARCAALLARDLRAYLARANEAEAVVALKTIALGMLRAWSDEPPRFCPGAPPTPAALAALAEAPAAVVRADWETEGWRCVRYLPATRAVRYQLELRTDPAERSYEIVARGRALAGGPLYELSLAGTVASETSLGADVLRRGAR